jgi:hypothetical protein
MRKKILYLPNINFEESLVQKTKTTPLLEQLQFVPLLFLQPEDTLLVSYIPHSTFLDHLKMVLGRPIAQCIDIKSLQPGMFDELQSWGYTQEVAVAADQFQIAYPHPDFELVKQINSKAFSFEYGKKLPGAQLIFTKEELESFVQYVPGKKVFKSCFGFSGLGHLFLEDTDEGKVLPFMEAEWALGRPCIAEPWVERVMDFSTQWLLRDDEQRLLGVTYFESSSRGRWQKTKITPYVGCPHVEEHLAFVAPLLEKIRQLGFFGNLGIDAMVYQHENIKILQPIVEINGRMTMSLAALLLAQQLKQSEISVEYTDNKKGLQLLPEYIPNAAGHIKRFKKQLRLFLLGEPFSIAMPKFRL